MGGSAALGAGAARALGPARTRMQRMPMTSEAMRAETEAT